MASVAHATTKARKTNQMTARSQRSALDKPLRTDLSFPSAASAGRRPGSDPRAESGLIVMLAHSASKTRAKALVPRASTSFCKAGSWTWRPVPTAFAALTQAVRGEGTVFYNSATPPSAPGCKLIRFETRTRTNGQYECTRPARSQTRRKEFDNGRRLLWHQDPR